MNFEDLWRIYLQGRPLAFDMDNTIYREIDFLHQAYKKISVELYGEDWESPYDYLCVRFKASGRKNLLNCLLQKFPLGSNKDNIDQCLKIMRASTVAESLAVYPWFSRFISLVEKPFELRIITNGNPQQQKNKFAALSFDRAGVTTDLICANDYGAKPNIEALAALRNSNLLLDLVYVGDSVVDAEFRQNAGIEFFDVTKSLTKLDADFYNS